METFGAVAVAVAVAVMMCGGMAWGLLSVRGLVGDGDRPARRRGSSPVVRCVDRGSRRFAVQWTEIDVSFPAAYPLSLNVHRHGWLDGPKIERGEMVDVQLGDPRFDAEFLVEAAPAEVAKQLLDAQVRRFLRDEPAVELFTLTETPGVLRLALREWRDTDERKEAVEIVSKIAAGVRAAYVSAEASAPVPAPTATVGAPYRAEPDGAAARQAEAAREAELQRDVQRVDDLRNKRANSPTAIYVFLIVVLSVVLAATMLQSP
jgi:hypothetical protein